MCNRSPPSSLRNGVRRVPRSSRRPCHRARADGQGGRRADRHRRHGRYRRRRPVQLRRLRHRWARAHQLLRRDERRPEDGALCGRRLHDVDQGHARRSGRRGPVHVYRHRHRRARGRQLPGRDQRAPESGALRECGLQQRRDHVPDEPGPGRERHGGCRASGRPSADRVRRRRRPATHRALRGRPVHNRVRRLEDGRRAQPHHRDRGRRPCRVRPRRGIRRDERPPLPRRRLHRHRRSAGGERRHASRRLLHRRVQVPPCARDRAGRPDIGRLAVAPDELRVPQLLRAFRPVPPSRLRLVPHFAVVPDGWGRAGAQRCGSRYRGERPARPGLHPVPGGLSARRGPLFESGLHGQPGGRPRRLR